MRGQAKLQGFQIYGVNQEEELSQFVGKEDTILLNYGYQGIMSAIDALLDRKDVVVYDQLALELTDQMSGS